MKNFHEFKKGWNLQGFLTSLLQFNIGNVKIFEDLNLTNNYYKGLFKELFLIPCLRHQVANATLWVSCYRVRCTTLVGYIDKTQENIAVLGFYFLKMDISGLLWSFIIFSKKHIFHLHWFIKSVGCLNCVCPKSFILE